MTVAVDSSAMVVRPDARTDVQFEDLEQYRRELTGYAYRMLGSAFEADDAVQETMVRAWKALDTFEGRSAVRSWLYRIATNVCLDMLRGRQRRARAMDFGGPYPADSFRGDTLPEQAWMTPIPDARVLPSDGDPAELAAERDTIRLAFVAALNECQGYRLTATAANGAYAYGSCKPDPSGGFMPWVVQVIEVSGVLLVAHHNFIGPEMFELFGLPPHLP